MCAPQNLGGAQSAAYRIDHGDDVQEHAHREHHRADAHRIPQLRLRRGSHSCAPDSHPGREALQSCDRGRRHQLLGAPLGARALRVAGVTTGIARHRAQAFPLLRIAHVIDQRPRAIERGGPEEIRAPGDDIARGIAYAAADAFDAGVGGTPLFRRRLDTGKVVMTRFRAFELTPGPRPLVEEIAHVRREILDHREVATAARSRARCP